jgi:hypothetical protein
MQDIRDRLGSKEQSVKESVKGAVLEGSGPVIKGSSPVKQLGLKWSQSGSKTQADSSHRRREMD